MSDGEGTADAARLVLVIDDEAAVRAVLSRGLSRRGWTVREAGDRDAAIATLQAEPALGVVLCDLRMPDFGGAALLAWLREHRPELLGRVVFASGDLGDEQAVALLASSGAPAVQKPFSMNELQGVLERAFLRTAAS